MPCSSSYRATRRMQPAASRPAQVVAGRSSRGSLGATCTTVMSYAALRARRTTPLSVDGEEVAQHPDHRGDAGAGGDEQQLGLLPRDAAGSTNSPAACSRWTSVPGRESRTRWLLTLPSGTALTVIEIRPSARGPWVSE